MNRKPINLKNITSILFIAVLSFIVFILPIKLGTPYIDEIGFFVPNLVDLLFGTWPSIALCALAVFLSIIIALDFLADKNFKISFSLNSIILFFFLIICGLSLIRSVNIHSSKINFLLLLSASTGFFAAKRLTNKNTPEIFLLSVYTAILCSAVFVSVNGIYQYFYGLDEMRQYIDMQSLKKAAVLYKNTDIQKYALYLRLISNRIFSTFVYPNSLAGYLCMVIPFSLELFRFSKKQIKFIYLRTVIISAFILVIWFFIQFNSGFIPIALLSTVFFPVTLFISLLLTLSKGGFLTITVFLLIYAFALMKNRFKLNKKKFFIAIFIILAVMGILGVFAKTMLHPNLKSFNARLKYWQASKSMITEKTLTGFGIGSFGSVYPKYRVTGSEETQFTHNIYLQIFTETGILGALSFFLLIVIPLSKFLLKSNNGSDIFYTACGFSLLTFFTHGFIDFDFSIPVLMFYAFFMIGALDKSEKKYFLSLPALKYIAVFFILLLFLMFKRIANYIDAQAYFNAAHYIFNEQKNPNKALEYLHQARKRDKDNSAINFLAGSIYLSGNHIEDAIINFKKAVKDNPYRAAYHYHLARALALSGSRKNKEKAMFEFSEALSYNPLRIEYQKAYDQYKKDFLSYENTGS